MIRLIAIAALAAAATLDVRPATAAMADDVSVSSTPAQPDVVDRSKKKRMRSCP